MNTRQKENIARADAIAYFAKKEITVAIPLNDAEEYDLVVDLPKEGLRKVQCKFSGQTRRGVDKGYSVGLRVLSKYTRGGTTEFKEYTKKSFDLLYVYCSNGRSFLIPIKKILGIKQIVVGLKSYNEYELHK